MATDCHGTTTNYTTCMSEAFAEGTSASADAFAHYHLVVSITACLVFLAAAWMMLSVYQSWAAGSLKFNNLINTVVRIIVVTSISIYLIS